MATIHIVIADDHKIVRQGIRALLEMEQDFAVMGEASCGQEALRLVKELEPDVLVTDLGMPDINGIEVTRRALGLDSDIRVVVLSMHGNEAYVLEALRSGARGYVLKESGMEELAIAVRLAADGGLYLSPPLLEGRVAALRDQLLNQLRHSGANSAPGH